jgi:hypothetical protein
MAASRVQDYLTRFSDEMIKFNPYAIHKMGLLQSQTLLKMEDYMLICAPYQLSMKRAILLVILSREETLFFQRFQNRITSLSFTFQKPGNKSPINLFIRGTLDRIGPVKGKANVCMVDLSYKNCPLDLVEIIGDYILTYQSLKGRHESFQSRTIEISEQSARVLRFNNYIECQVLQQKVQGQLLSLAVSELKLRVPAALEGVAEGEMIFIKLYFQTYQFIVSGRITRAGTVQHGARELSCSIGFAPELVEIMDDYFFRLSFKKE